MTPQRIKDAADAYVRGLSIEHSKAHKREGYIAGATAENERAQGLVDALEEIDNSPTPANEREMHLWIQAARILIKEALAKWKGEVEHG